MTTGGQDKPIGAKLKQLLHKQERRQFERLLHQQRVDRVADRLKVLEAFLASEDHYTAGEWQQELAQAGVELEPEFVARTLELLVGFGLATRREFEGALPRYEHRHLDEHHDHLICTRCGTISEFHSPELETLKASAAAEQGFHHLHHKLQIYGLCRACLAQREPTMPLAQAAAGELVRVEKIMAGEQECRQLNAMGLCEGNDLEVLSANGGPVTVSAKGSRVAVGRDLAQQVMVSQTQPALPWAKGAKSCKGGRKMWRHRRR